MVLKSTPLELPTFQSLTASQARVSSAQTPVTPVSHPSSDVARQAESASLPLLPKGKRPQLSSHRNDANAALALNLLTDVGETITGWHQALRQILADLQTLYMAGPIVDGWLEAVPPQGHPPPPDGTSDQGARVFRHGDAAQIAAYVKTLAQTASPETPQGSMHYRLCSLDADGKVTCQSCPPDQLGVISQAIARHQQLRQLLSQKHYLEARLKRAADALEQTRQALDIPAKGSSTPEC